MDEYNPRIKDVEIATKYKEYLSIRLMKKQNNDKRNKNIKIYVNADPPRPCNIEKVYSNNGK